MTPVRTLLSLICVIAACNTQTTARAEGHHQSGINGQVIFGTWAPGLDIPVQCYISIETDSGKTDQIIQTDADGFFHIALKPGKYILTPFMTGPADPGPEILPGPEVTVIVDKKNYTNIQMTLTSEPIFIILPPVNIPPIGIPNPLPPPPLPPVYIPINPPPAGGVIIRQPIIPPVEP